MSEIKYINSDMPLVLNNAELSKHDPLRKPDPVYISYDEHWQEISRCHNFSGVDCEMVFEEAKEATYSNAATPKRVYIIVHGPVVFDPEIPEVRDPKFLVVPSHRGMDAELRQPIWVNGIAAYSRLTITGPYLVQYEFGADRVLWVECDECVGFNG